MFDHIPTGWGFVVRGLVAIGAIAAPATGIYAIWTNPIRLWKTGESQKRIVDSGVTHRRIK